MRYIICTESLVDLERELPTVVGEEALLSVKKIKIRGKREHEDAAKPASRITKALDMVGSKASGASVSRKILSQPWRIP